MKPTGVHHQNGSATQGANPDAVSNGEAHKLLPQGNMGASKPEQQSYPLSMLIFFIVGYSISSSCLTILNKYALVVFPYAGFLTAFQFFTSAIVVWFLGQLGRLTVEPLKWPIIKAFLPAVILYYLSIFTNTKVLEYANVDTFIVFRSSTPLFVAILETVYLRSPLPSMKTFGSMLVILSGAVAYVVFDSEFNLRSYLWATAYVLAMTIDMVLIKKIVTDVGLSTWGLVYYNNAIAFILFPIATFLTGEMKKALDVGIFSLADPGIAMPVLLSCLGGLSISYFGFSCRKAFSATTFTVTGVVNKFLTVLVNVSIWDKHASPPGIVSLLVTIVGGVLYQQSLPKKGAKATPPPETQTQPDSDIESKLPAQGQT